MLCDNYLDIYRESIDLSTARGLDKRTISDLATMRFVREGFKVIIMGPTGVGKTFLASALGHSACRNNVVTLFFRMNHLLEQLAWYRAKGGYLNLLKRLVGCELLILDDFGIKPLLAQQYQDFYDILDERGEGKPLVMTSQLPVENWKEVIADPVSCEAISDRIASGAIKIILKGNSYRCKRDLSAGSNE